MPKSTLYKIDGKVTFQKDSYGNRNIHWAMTYKEFFDCCCPCDAVFVANIIYGDGSGDGSINPDVNKEDLPTWPDDFAFTEEELGVIWLGIFTGDEWPEEFPELWHGQEYGIWAWRPDEDSPYQIYDGNSEENNSFGYYLESETELYREGSPYQDPDIIFSGQWEESERIQVYVPLDNENPFPLAVYTGERFAIEFPE